MDWKGPPRPSDGLPGTALPAQHPHPQRVGTLGPDHSEVVVDRLEGAAEQFGAVGVRNLPDAAAVLRGPDAHGGIERGGHEDVVGEGPGKVGDTTGVAPQDSEHGGRGGHQLAQRDAAVEGAAGQAVPVVIGEAHSWDCNTNEPFVELSTRTLHKALPCGPGAPHPPRRAQRPQQRASLGWGRDLEPQKALCQKLPKPQ